MTVAAKAIRYHFIAVGSGLVGELAIVYAAIYFEKVELLFVLGPLAVLLVALLWANKVTGIRCPTCNNIYGVSIGSRGWPSVPAKCLLCGSAGE